MTILIGAVLFASVIFSLTYRTLQASGRCNAGTGNPVLQRWLQSSTGDGTGVSDSAAEAHEAELNRRLRSGDLDAVAYRKAMTELTQQDAARTEKLK